MKRQVILFIRKKVIYYLLIIDLWKVVKWILCCKKGGGKLQLFLDCTSKYLIDTSINSVYKFYLLFYGNFGPGFEMKIKIKR
jgi:hypothetical protein